MGVAVVPVGSVAVVVVHRVVLVAVAVAAAAAGVVAVSVVVEHGGGGSKVAAPVGRDILLETQHRIEEEGATTTAGNTMARRDG